MSKEKVKKEPYDLGAERVILGYLFQYGMNILPDIEMSISKDDLYDNKNQAIFSCLQTIINETGAKTVTVDSVLTSAKILNLHSLLTKEDVEFLKICKQQNISKEELPQFIRPIKFWSVVRKFKTRCKGIDYLLDKLSGQETITEIISKVEETVFDFIPSLLQEDDIVDISDFIEGYVDYLSENPVEIPGLPSGFPKYDAAIGGGFRRGTINVTVARPKVGKSFMCLNVAKNLTEQGIPVLYLDTELNKEIQTNRWLSLWSKIETNDIEIGAFTKEEHTKTIVKEAVDNIKEAPFHHVVIAGKNIDDIQSIVRRWLHHKVGVDENGKTNDCLIILDYIKVMDLKELGNFQEYQYLGDLMTKLHNFAVKYEIPVFATAQVNRDGITKDSSDIVSGSDRILWLCSSLTVLKNKTPEDFASGDTKTYGDKKLIVLDTRFGPGMDVSTGEYINVISKLERSYMVEGKYNHENQGMINLDDDDEESEGVPL